MARAFAVAVLVASSLGFPGAAHAATDTFSMFWNDGPSGYAQSGHVQSPGVTVSGTAAPYAEVTFTPQDTPMVTGFFGPDSTQIAPGTYTDATFPQLDGHPYFRTYDAQVCWNPPNYGSGQFVVHAVAFDQLGVLTKLSVDLVYHCAGQTIQHYRVVRYNDAEPVSWLQLPNGTTLGNTHVGVPKDQTVAVANLGASTEHVTGVVLSGAQADEFAIHDDGCSGTDVPAGGSCDIVVRALPTQAGTSSALVTVTSDAFTAAITGRISQSATIATSVSLAGNGTTAAANTNVNVHAAVTPSNAGGTVDFYVDGTWAGFGNVNGTGTASGSLQPQTPGSHALVARYSPQQGSGWDSSESDPLTIDFKQPTSVTLTSNHNPVLTGVPVTLTAVANPSVPPSGTLTITDETTSTVLASGPVGGAVNTVAVTTTFGSVGTHVIRADLASGAPEFLSSTTTLDQVVSLDDFVDASGFGFSLPSIYPVTDGYRDRVAIKGVRGEPASVAITVTSSATGKVVGRGSVPAGTGPYQWLWTGRTGTGAVLPAGSYRVSQVLTDAKANQLGWSRSIPLSTKKLVTLTYSKTLNGNQFQSFGRSGNGTVAKRTTPYPHEVRLEASLPGWAAAEWSFTLPSATVNKGLRFYVNGSASGTAQLCVWHPAYGSYLDLGSYDCPEFLRQLHATYGASVSPATHISAHHVHGLVYVGRPYSRSVAHVAWVKVVFTYGVLR